MDNELTKVFSLQGRAALVTGATGYLGREISLALAQAGAHVIVNSRSEETGRAAVSQLLSAGFSAEHLAFDVCDVAANSERLTQMFEMPLGVIVNNAYEGCAGSIESSHGIQYQNSYKLAVVAVHDLVTLALPALRKSVADFGDASVVNIASMYGLVSPDLRDYDDRLKANPPFYGAAKAALVQWTKYAACEFGLEGIRFNSISPGPFPAEGVKADNPQFVDRLANKVPLGRVGNASEIGGPVLFLASRASSFVNGSNLVVDGGWTAW